MESRKIAKIAVSSITFNIDRPYDYRVPEELTAKITPGMRVTVPFGNSNRKSEGIVLSVTEDSQAKNLKCIQAALDVSPVITAGQLKLALWMRDRFFCTVYDAMHAMLPSGMWFKDGQRRASDKIIPFASLAVSGEEARDAAEQKRMKSPRQSSVLKLLSEIGGAPVREICYFTGVAQSTLKSLEKAGLIQIEQMESFRRPDYSPAKTSGEVVLNDEQQSVFEGLSKLVNSRKAEAALLFGVTGSGKTLVYIKLIQEMLSGGRNAIVLVPEISLTPQLVSIFASYFGDKIAVLHSSLAIGERYDEWKRIKSGNVQVVIGTRSAVFAPIENLGILIIDEEQEYTYKSENSPRYNARDVAKYLCVQSEALLLLGSATPSIESMNSALEGKYKLFRMDKRFNERPLPKVLIADMKQELKNGNNTTISSLLRDELKENLRRGEQSILFINRRGASNFVVCGECGETFTCPNCSVSMTYHMVNRRLMCHYCGFSQPVPDECTQCGGKLNFVGAGTQKVESELHEQFPNTEIIRMDTDTVTASKSHEKLLSRFRNHKVPILVGTQMVTKGLDFENVTLVGVISADQSLYVNNYRAHERTFSLITQVVGRSGRGSKEGRAVIQTYTPKNEVILLASNQDYDGFYQREIELRRILGCPPIADLLIVTVTGTEESAVLRGCVVIRNSLSNYLSDIDGIKILGPAPAAVAKVNNNYRFRISLSCMNSRRIRDTVAHVMREFSADKTNRGLSVFADSDPLE